MQNHRVLSQSVFVVAFGRAVEATFTTQHTTFHTFSESGIGDSVSGPLLHAPGGPHITSDVAVVPNENGKTIRRLRDQPSSSAIPGYFGHKPSFS